MHQWAYEIVSFLSVLVSIAVIRISLKQLRWALFCDNKENFFFCFFFGNFSVMQHRFLLSLFLCVGDLECYLECKTWIVSTEFESRQKSIVV